MGNIHYKILDWGHPTREGSNIQFDIGVCTKAKRRVTNPYEIANEMLCLRLGHALKLPVPSGGIVEHEDHLWFASLEFAVAEETLPRATSSDLSVIAANQWLACGILAFDCWIANEDRTRGNIRYDRDRRMTYLIDHGKALFCGPTPTVAVREMESLRDSLAIHHQNHCLAGKVTTLRDFPEWHSRIKAIPEYYIRESVQQSVELGLPADKADYCTEYLLYRRERLRKYFEDEHALAFPNLDKQVGLFDSPRPFQFEVGDYNFEI